MRLRDCALLCAGLGITLSGCSTVKPGGVTFDSESQTTIVTGNETTVSPLAGAVRTYFLKAEISPSQTGLYLVILYLSIDGWLSADKVVDSDGRKFEGLRGADESFEAKYGRITKEIYHIPVTRRYLEQHRNSGLNFCLRGTKGTLAATQPATYVQGFLTSLDSTQQRLAGEVIVKKLIAEPAKRGPAFRRRRLKAS